MFFCSVARCRCGVYYRRILDGELNFRCNSDSAERVTVPCSRLRGKARTERNRQRTGERTREGRNDGEPNARRRESEEQRRRSVDRLIYWRGTNTEDMARGLPAGRTSLRPLFGFSDSTAGIARRTERENNRRSTGEYVTRILRLLEWSHEEDMGRNGETKNTRIFFFFFDKDQIRTRIPIG